MSIHVYVLLCIENEEEVIIEEETGPQAEIPPIENISTLISLEQILKLLQYKESPSAFTHPCYFKLFIT
jgi:hypothetical protein